MNTSRTLPLVLLVLLAGAAGTLQAAAPGQPRPLSPLDAAAPTKPLAYDSAFAGYRSDTEPKRDDWKATNEAIAKAPGHMGHGGHAGHAGHAAHAGHDTGAMKPQDKPAADKAPSPTPPPADPHAGHKH